MVINLDRGDDADNDSTHNHNHNNSPMNIAMTHNYVSESNLSNVLKFSQERQSQISGCRDCTESIKPEHLYESLVAALDVYHPKALTITRRRVLRRKEIFASRTIWILTDDRRCYSRLLLVT
jgi:hypothetical protein